MTFLKPVVEPIAVIGSSCRFPGGASSPSRLWELVKQPRDIVKEIPPSRFNVEGFYHENGEHHGSSNVKHAYLLEEDSRVFDNSFFEISPREAETMDPQTRILLETVYEGIESAGYSIQQLRGSPTAVFVGLFNSDHMHQTYRDLDSLPQYAATGISISIVANRVSYFFDWHGPSVSVDTACSSSMVGLHQAVRALRNGESEMAIAAGTNIILGPEIFISQSKLHMLSPTGRSHMWDASVDGYTRGEGVGTVVLKKLSQAIADGDHIDCIIRETGVNQDGRTPGITMPSAKAQAALIQSLYSSCGLDLSVEGDRPQLIEAHGTGTPIGDPIEAEAIHQAFFPKDQEHLGHKKIPVGSIKTVIGHLEGASGIAGIIKASLALQKGIVSPNLHFENLNPKIKPFYENLYVPTAAEPWAPLPPGVPRRISVNSFGFGGTNAHAILESWGPTRNQQEPGENVQPESSIYGAGPFILSANSSQALSAMVAALSNHLKENPEISLADLAYTLSRRTEFPLRTSFSATSLVQLTNKLDNFKGHATRSLTLNGSRPLRILGIFTGQGAQWPTMGKELFNTSSVFRESINRMQTSLDELPDGPEWSLAEQLVASPEESRVHEAAISQPLCTAIQIALVDVLLAIGISFSAIVGHSSGEVGAAYAADRLNESDAIRIAYYRGVHAKLACGPQGQKGKMMAVSLSLDQATAFCKRIDAHFGKIGVAASNSRMSCTLAGDADAIDEAKRRLDTEGTFARLLKVDTAYHSHHMQPCAGPYLDSLRRCKISPLNNQHPCVWYSSVYRSDGSSSTLSTSDELAGQYWVNNMTQPVLFSEALQKAVARGEQGYDLALEIGPHPNLQGPTLETIKAVTGSTLPYSGGLKRGVNALESFADALGFIWGSFHSPRAPFEFDGIRRSFLGTNSLEAPKLLKDLPPYTWDHERILWKESYQSKMLRSRSEPIHELLGHCTSRGEPERGEMIWHQLLRVNEIPWSRGFVFQERILFPPSGYLIMAHEAAIRLVDDRRSLQLVELHDIEFHKTISLDEDSTGADVTFTIRVTDYSQKQITAEYTCFSSNADETGQDREVLVFSGQVNLILGTLIPNALPSRVVPDLPLESLEVNQFYSYLREAGLDYSGDFCAQSIQRRLNQATLRVRRPLSQSSFPIHPGTLDAAIQGLFAGFSFPGDKRLSSAYLPTTLNQMRINMHRQDGFTAPSSTVVADTTITHDDPKNLACNVSVFGDDDHPEIQLLGLSFKSSAPPQPRDDRMLFANHKWVRDLAYGIEPSQKMIPAEETKELDDIYLRTTYYYLRKLSTEIDPSEVPKMAWHHQHLVRFVQEDLMPRVEAGRYPRVSKEWATDTAEMVEKWLSNNPGSIDLQLANAMGKNLLSIVRGNVPPLQVMMQNGMLDRFYVEGLGFREANHDLSVFASQLVHQHPNRRILEIGAGTGGATSNVLPAIQGHFESYTYTDISPGFFERAREIFSDYSDKMIFKTLDIEKDISGQGYECESYDLIIASNVLHATRRLEDTLRKCRSLLRPGGHIMLIETTLESLRWQFMGTLPGWFLGIEDGRVWAPGVSEDRWDTIFKNTGFSGVDSSSSFLFSVMVSQAVDDATTMLRKPLATSTKSFPQMNNLIIIGGESSSSSQLSNSVRDLLDSKFSSTAIISNFEDITEKQIDIPPQAMIISLSDLDSAFFRNINKRRFQGLQEIICKSPKAILWVTHGAKSGDSPVNSMITGWGRCIQNENPDINLQLLDLDKIEAASPEMLAEMLLRLALADRPEFKHVKWAIEPEVALIDGAIYFPRVWRNEQLNDRYNSTKRDITREISLSDVNRSVELCESHGSFDLRESFNKIKTGSTQIEVYASSAWPLTGSDGKLTWLSIGSVKGSGEKVVAVSHSRFSRTAETVADTDIFPWRSQNINEDYAHLHSLLSVILAELILLGVKSSIWIHGADDSLAHTIRGVAELRGIDVMRPIGIEAFVNLELPRNEALHNTICSSLLATTKFIKGFGMTFDSGVILPHSSAVFRDYIKHYVQIMQNKPPAFVSQLNSSRVITLDEVHTLGAETMHPLTIINWRATDKVSVQVRPVQHNGFFSANKTYLLFGLTGDLGLSIVEWMVDHGARYIVISSRFPKVSQTFVKHVAHKGATLRVVALDITNRDALHKVYAEVKAKMPPVGGVMNGAIVLHDRTFLQASLDDFATVMAPRVQGSQYLDELFHDTNLEFMIFFSSISAVIGNPGQAAYAAANLFMTGLADQRRRRGVPASVLYLGMVVGVGYIHHAESRAKYELQLQRNGCTAISEADLHHMIAEAIICGRPDSTQPADLITGLQKVNTAAWRDNPRFGLNFSEEGEPTQRSEQPEKQKKETVASQLAAARSDEEALQVIQKGLARMIGKILQTSKDQLYMDVTPSNLGIDSLVAVQVRSWFVKEVGANIPVMMVLGNYTLAQLCKEALAARQRSQD
ncbi:hypothetical protein K445DRAFT_366105 [Daldinia sp. EC12]|nr:hypothetical protein K445DRAFT_366105 [Daldinia sp. EC12]